MKTNFEGGIIITLKDLEQYSTLVRLEKETKTELMYMYKNGGRVTDRVSGSMGKFPYTEVNFSITGEDEQTRQKIENLEKIYRNRFNIAQDKRIEIENFIDDIDIPEIKLIVQLRYIKCCTWMEVSNRVYGYPGEKARFKINRFFSKK